MTMAPIELCVLGRFSVRCGEGEVATLSLGRSREQRRTLTVQLFTRTTDRRTGARVARFRS